MINFYQLMMLYGLHICRKFVELSKLEKNNQWNLDYLIYTEFHAVVILILTFKNSAS